MSLVFQKTLDNRNMLRVQGREYFLFQNETGFVAHEVEGGKILVEEVFDDEDSAIFRIQAWILAYVGPQPEDPMVKYRTRK